VKILEEVAFHRISASGPKWADRGGSALPFPSKIKNQKSKINIHHSSILPPNTPMATSRPTTAGQPYLPIFCSKSSSYFRVRSRDSRFNFFLTPMATSRRTTAGQAEKWS
jgi:hypothetical protein